MLLISGDAILGFLKFLVPLTYCVLIMQYTEKDIQKIIKVIPISALMMIFICIIAKYLPYIPNYFYLSNGRMAGFFQYSNTFALFLLIGIISLIESDCIRIKKYIGIAILLIGIYATGSRSIFLLTILNLVITIIRNKSIRKYLFIILLTSIIVTAAYTLITKDYNTFGRYITMATNSNTLIERLLYYKDAIELIIKNPFGIGFKGYSYMQPQIQTGVYNAVYIHNDFLQIILDIGLLPAIIFMLAIICSFYRNSIKNFDMRKQILLTILLHIIIDFDLQFIYIFFILVMSLDIYKGKQCILKEHRKFIIITIILIAIIYLYFGICTLFHHINKDKIATKMYPIYTEANVNIMNNQVESDIKKANEIANKILSTNKEFKGAYDVKSLYYMEKGFWNLMVMNKQKSIEIAKYDIENYEEYILMLSGAINYYALEGNLEELNKYIKYVTNVPSIIDKVKKETSDSAYKLRNKPNFELNDEMKKYIEDLKKSI